MRVTSFRAFSREDGTSEFQERSKSGEQTLISTTQFNHFIKIATVMIQSNSDVHIIHFKFFIFCCFARYQYRYNLSSLQALVKLSRVRLVGGLITKLLNSTTC